MTQIDENLIAYKNTYNEKEYIHIRKTYTNKNGELKPGKGIAMSTEEWSKFCSMFDEIVKDINSGEEYEF